METCQALPRAQGSAHILHALAASSMSCDRLRENAHTANTVHHMHMLHRPDDARLDTRLIGATTSAPLSDVTRVEQALADGDGDARALCRGGRARARRLGDLFELEHVHLQSMAIRRHSGAPRRQSRGSQEAHAADGIVCSSMRISMRRSHDPRHSDGSHAPRCGAPGRGRTSSRAARPG